MSDYDYPFAATLTPERVKEHAKAIAEVSETDPEKAHAMEDDLWHEALTAIAISAVTGTDAILVALHAASTKQLGFPRWCA